MLVPSLATLALAAAPPLAWTVTAASPLDPPSTAPPSASTPAASSPLAGYLTPEALAAKFDAMAHADSATCVSIPFGTSADGRPLTALRLSKAPPSNTVPTLLVVAGLDGTHLLGPEIAWRVAERIAKEHGELLEGRALLIVPQVNPDAAARTLASPGNPFSRTPRAVDDDRDGRADEDGPEDLDGDGVVTLMRVANPAPPAVATLVADPAEPRLLRTADPVKGERPLYRLLVEGIDNDGDGLINEDAPGGVDLDRNFMHRWPEFEDGAGPYPLSEPESLALARFVIGHPEIALGLTYGRHDNLVKLPRADATDVNPQIPLELDAADLPLHTELARIFKESTGQTRAPSMNSAGSFEAWLYAQRGVPSLATVVWGRPDPKPETKPEAKPETKPETKPDGKPDPAAETKPTDAPQAAAAPGATSAPVAPPAQPPAAPPPAAGGATPPGVPGGPPGGGGRRQGRGGGGGPGGGFGGPPGARTARPVTTDAPVGDVAEETAWLKYSDSERDGSGFVAWHPFKHPTLGDVEIGGFLPLFRIDPPADQLDALADKQAAFVVELLKRLPKLEVVEPTVEVLADGLYRVRLAIRNDGALPTHTAYAKRQSIGEPCIVRLTSPVDQGLAGRRVERFRGLEGGGQQRFEWLVRGKAGDAIDVIVRLPGAKERKLAITLPAAKEEGK